MGSGLQAAHDLGVVHRDLKPANIFLCAGPHDEVVKILDFGASKVSDPTTELTGAGAMIGSPWYMSPEQVRGESGQVTHLADIFAVGVLLFEMLTRRVPFDGEDMGELCRKIAYSDPPPLRSLRPDLPASLDRPLRRALAKDPRDRQPSVRSLVEELLDAAAGSESGPDWRPALDSTEIQPSPLPLDEEETKKRARPRVPSTGPAAVVAPEDDEASLAELRRLAAQADWPRRRVHWARVAFVLAVVALMGAAIAVSWYIGRSLP
jgi:serine/threonine protein kinase